MNYTNKRPVYLDLLRIKQPVTAVLSIGHRISGVVWFFALPFLLYLFDVSLSSQSGFNHVTGILANGLVKVVMFILFWAFVHHLFAGIRFLLIDIDIGIERQTARFGAWIVHVSELIVVFITLVWLL
jgi:succinate dehydrogenase / fumarate reductase cytochrome b subunit